MAMKRQLRTTVWDTVSAAFEALVSCPSVLKLAFGLSADRERMLEAALLTPKAAAAPGWVDLQAHSPLSSLHPHPDALAVKAAVATGDVAHDSLMGRIHIGVVPGWGGAEASLGLETSSWIQHGGPGLESREAAARLVAMQRAPRLPSLRSLCEALLDKTLDKQQQRSDWSRRPLSEEQVQYAALDAFVLVRLLFALLALDIAPSAALSVLPGAV